MTRLHHPCNVALRIESMVGVMEAKGERRLFVTKRRIFMTRQDFDFGRANAIIMKGNRLRLRGAEGYRGSGAGT